MPAAVLPLVNRGDPADPIAGGGFAREDPPPGLRAGAADLAVPAARQTTALALAQASARPDGAAPAQPWDHPDMMVQCEKAVSYAAERAAAKQHQNIRVLRIGIIMVFAIGTVLMIVAQLVVQMQVGLYVAAAVAFTFGVCIMLTVDYDVNEYFLRRRWLFCVCAGLVLFMNVIVWYSWFWGSASARTSAGVTWSGALVVTPHSLWILWCQNEIREQREGRAFPNVTELPGVHFALFYGALLGHFIVVTDDLGSPNSVITTGVLVLGIWLLVWISLARSRWGVVGGARRQRWLAMAADAATPSQRAFLCVAVGCAPRVPIVCLSMIPPPAGEARSITVPVIYILLVVLPMVATWVKRDVVFFAINSLFERRQRLQDGGFVASLLGTAQEALRVGDTWWVNDPEARAGSPRPAWLRASVTGIEDGKFVIDLPAQISLPRSVLRRTFISALPPMTPEALVRAACQSLFRVPMRDIGAVHLRRAAACERVAEDEISASLGFLAGGGVGGGDAARGALEALRDPCRPGETDWFLSHSWHDDRTAKQAALAAIGSTLMQRTGREATVWFDRVCVHPAFREESLQCVPVYVHACRGMLVLCGPTYFTRLWCVWELYTLFAFAKAQSLMVAVLRGRGEDEAADDGGGGSGGAALRVMQRRLERFSLADAHCFDPNEERQLRAAINAAPGGVPAFQATVRSLATRLIPHMDAHDFSGVDVLKVGHMTSAGVRLSGTLQVTKVNPARALA